MNNESAKQLRRRLCLALPVALLGGTASAAEQEYHWPLGGAQSVKASYSFEVALKLDLFGELIEPVVKVFDRQRTTLRGMHDGTPWSMELTIARHWVSEKLYVATKLIYSDKVLAAPIRTGVVGQRIVLHADDDVYAAVRIKGL